MNPEELKWHEAVRDALNSNCRDPNFFVWINVDPETTDAEVEDVPLDDLARRVDEWLGTLDPDENPADGPRQETFDVSGLAVRVSALAKKASARGRSAPIVGNPVPAFAYWTGN